MLPENRVRARTRPKASSVPSTVPTIIVTSAISRLAISELAQRLAVPKNAPYHWRLKPLKFCSDRTQLNENSTTITSGSEHERVERGGERARSALMTAPREPAERR